MKRLIAFLFIGTLSLPVFPLSKNDSPTAPKSHGVSWAPMLGYSSGFGLLLGVSYFRKPLILPNYDLATTLLVTLKPNVASMSEIRYLASDTWHYYARVRVSNFFTPYYGEGDQTVASDLKEIKNWAGRLVVGPEYFFTPQLSTSLFSDVRTRDGSGGVIPAETTWSGGGFLRYNNKNLEQPSFFEQRHEILVRGTIPHISNAPGVSAFSQVEADLRIYFNLMADLGFATRGFYAHSFGEPTYLYRYSLGGAEVLRGHRPNRFRGKHVVALQEEFRFPIFRAISGVVFTDIGDTADNGFHHFKISYGGGLRFGLPPDFVAKLRFDVGFSYDEMGVFFLYGDTF